MLNDANKMSNVPWKYKSLMINAHLKNGHWWPADWFLRVFPLVPHQPGCHSSIVAVDERPVQRGTQVKRQLAIDCGQKGFRYISYCRCASSADLKREIDVLQDCFDFFFFSHGESCQWIWRGESIFRGLWLCCTQTQASSWRRKSRTQVSLQGFFYYKIQTKMFFFLFFITGLLGPCLLQKTGRMTETKVEFDHNWTFPLGSSGVSRPVERHVLGLQAFRPPPSSTWLDSWPTLWRSFFCPISSSCQLKPENSRKGSWSHGASMLLLVGPEVSSRLGGAVSSVCKHLQPIMKISRCFQHASCDLKEIIGLETKLFVVSPQIFSDYRCISSAPCLFGFFARTLLAFDSIILNRVWRAAWPHIACRHSSLMPS